MEIVINISGQAVGESLGRLWEDSHDMRDAETKYADDVLRFVDELLDEIDDPDLDRMIAEHVGKRLTPDRTRALAAALLRAADEAEGPNTTRTKDEHEARTILERVLPYGHFLGSGFTSVTAPTALDNYRDAVAKAEQARIAEVIRAHINMKGLDFPDAEAVADWLEGK